MDRPPTTAVHTDLFDAKGGAPRHTERGWGRPTRIPGWGWGAPGPSPPPPPIRFWGVPYSSGHPFIGQSAETPQRRRNGQPRRAVRRFPGLGARRPWSRGLTQPPPPPHHPPPQPGSPPPRQTAPAGPKAEGWQGDCSRLVAQQE